MNAPHQDITATIGPMWAYAMSNREVQMYSYERPAYNFWQGFYEVLVESGMSHEAALLELTHSAIRHFLDNNDDAIHNLGRTLAAKYIGK
jgi:hypothetical protein